MKNIDADYEQALDEERLLLEATEMIEELLEEQRINRKELADRLGKSKGHVSQLLSGERNLTLRTLAELAYNLNHRLHISAQPISEPASAWYTRSRRRADRDPAFAAALDGASPSGASKTTWWILDRTDSSVFVEPKTLERRSCKSHIRSHHLSASPTLEGTADMPWIYNSVGADPRLCSR